MYYIKYYTYKENRNYIQYLFTRTRACTLTHNRYLINNIQIYSIILEGPLYIKPSYRVDLFYKIESKNSTFNYSSLL